MLEPHPYISRTRQCELLDISRSGTYYRPRAESELNVRVMHRIDELYTQMPYYGSRRMTAHLQQEGLWVNRKRGRIKSGENKATEVLMTIAEQLEQRGIEKGELRGIAKGKAASLVELVSLKFGPESLSSSLKERIEEANVEDFDRWTRAILTSETLEELFH